MMICKPVVCQFVVNVVGVEQRDENVDVKECGWHRVRESIAELVYELQCRSRHVGRA